MFGFVALCGPLPSSEAQEPAGEVARVTFPPAEDADGEHVPAGEADALAQLKKLSHDVMTASGREKPTRRDQHPKHHGFLKAKFTVLGDIPGELKVGLFREPRSYTAVIRFSNTKSDDDSVPDTHGMAIKLFGVPGEKLLEDEKDTQDFILLDHPLFFAPDVVTLLEANKLQSVLERDEALKKRTEGLLPAQGNEEVVRVFARQMPKEAMIVKLRKRLIPNPLATSYYSTTPYNLSTAPYQPGKLAVKYSAKPEPGAGPGGTEVKGKDYLRDAMVDQLTTREQPAAFGFYVQRQGRAMPIEDPTVEWMSPWEKVATIEIPGQVFCFREREEWGDVLSYTPWHALKEHQPLGGINRARKGIYPVSSEERHKNLDKPRKEPTEAEIPTR